MYKPKRVLIYRGVKNSPYTIQIVDSIKKLDENIPIEYVDSRRPDLPDYMDAADRFHYMKETLVLSDRTSSFIETFASPGQIVENLGTMVKSLFHCSANCHYCYLQRTALRQQWQRIYVNLDELGKQMKSELVINRINRVILKAFENYKGEQLLKIPSGFKEYTDSIRSDLLKQENLTDAYAIKHLKIILADALLYLNKDLDRDILTEIKNNVRHTYKLIRQTPLEFNVGEYSDILGIEHIAGHLDYFMNLVQKNKDFRIKFSTKFTNIDSLLKYPGDDRVKITMDLSTLRMIDEYEKGTSPLKERLEAIREIQNTGGYIINVRLEPMFCFQGDEKEYTDLIDKTFQVVDIKKINKITLGLSDIPNP